MSIVASKDGTNVYGSGNGTIDPTKLIQVGKLVKIENIHLPLFAVCASITLSVLQIVRRRGRDDGRR